MGKSLTCNNRFFGYFPFDLDNSLSGQMNRYRFEGGLFRYQLAEKAGIDPTIILHWERGDSKSKVRYLFKLQECFECIKNVEPI